MRNGNISGRFNVVTRQITTLFPLVALALFIFSASNLKSETLPGTNLGGIVKTTVLTPGPKETGEEPWYRNPFYNGNLRLAIPIPIAGGQYRLLYNSIKCEMGWRLSIDLELESLTSGKKTIIDPEQKRIDYIGNTVINQWTFLNPLYDRTVITPNALGYFANLENGDKLYFHPKTGSNTLFQLAQHIDKNGNTTVIDRTNASSTVVTDPYGRSITISRGAKGEVTSIEDIRGSLFNFDYDSSGRLIKVRYPPDGNDSKEWRITYNDDLSANDMHGNPIDPAKLACIVTSIQEPQKRITSYVSYADGVIKEIHDFGMTAFSYTANSVTRETGGKFFVDTYDTTKNRLVASGEASTYLACGLVTSYTWSIDNLNNIVRIDAPYGQSHVYTYWRKKLKTHTDPSGIVTRYDDFDNDGNPGVMTAGAQTTFYTWQRVGYQNLVETITKGQEIKKYVYDTKGNLKEVYENSGGTVGAEQLLLVESYAYNSRGQLTEANTKDGADRYDYDSNGNLITATEKGLTTSYQFTSTGEPVQITGPNGIQTVFSEPDALGIPTRETVYALRSGGAVVSDVKREGCASGGCSVSGVNGKTTVTTANDTTTYETLSTYQRQGQEATNSSTRRSKKVVTFVRQGMAMLNPHLLGEEHLPQDSFTMAGPGGGGCECFESCQSGAESGYPPNSSPGYDAAYTVKSTTQGPNGTTGNSGGGGEGSNQSSSCSPPAGACDNASNLTCNGGGECCVTGAADDCEKGAQCKEDEKGSTQKCNGHTYTCNPGGTADNGCPVFCWQH